jgi:hypothetical protein
MKNKDDMLAWPAARLCNNGIGEKLSYFFVHNVVEPVEGPEFLLRFRLRVEKIQLKIILYVHVQRSCLWVIMFLNKLQYSRNIIEATKILIFV